MIIYKEKPGIIGDKAVWVCFHREYLYMASTLPGLLLDIIKNWNDDTKLSM